MKRSKNTCVFQKALLIALFAMFVSVFAHGVLLLVEDNGDGTIYIEAGLSTGGSAEGASVVLRERASGRPIFMPETTIPAEGFVNVPQPSVPYTVTVSLGEGHSATRNGPLPSARPAAKTEPAQSHHYHDGKRCTGRH